MSPTTQPQDDAGLDATAPSIDARRVDMEASDAERTRDGDVEAAAAYPAHHSAAPQRLTYGGPVLGPHVIPVFYANDPMQAQLQQFLSPLATSSYWSTATSEYGVGALIISPSIVTTDTAPTSITASDLRASLAGHIGGASPDWPAPETNDLYVLSQVCVRGRSTLRDVQQPGGDRRDHFGDVA
jgi:hypothetical protein